jgi:hypothetical protein
LPEGDGWRENIAAAEANRCDNRGMHLKIATFNTENLFTRPSVIAQADLRRGSGGLQDDATLWNRRIPP